MRKVTGVAIVASLVLALAGAAPAVVIPLPNGDAESNISFGTTGGGIPYSSYHPTRPAEYGDYFSCWNCPENAEASAVIVTLTDTFIGGQTYTFWATLLHSDHAGGSGTFILGYDNSGAFVELNRASYTAGTTYNSSYTESAGVSYDITGGSAAVGKPIVLKFKFFGYGTSAAKMNGYLWVDNFQLTYVPEPVTMGLLLAGGALLVVRRRRRTA